MCVIAIKPAGVDVDSDVLTDMWEANKDGGGLAYYNHDGSLVVKKGYMNAVNFATALYKLTEYEVVFHLRLATHGEISKQQCHPFALDAETIKEIVNPRKSASVLFHNGIVHGFGRGKYSDTIDFVHRVVSRIPDLEAKLEVLEMTHSKYVLMHQGELHLVGEFEEADGLIVSNLHWDRSYRYKTFSNVFYNENRTPSFKEKVKDGIKDRLNQYIDDLGKPYDYDYDYDYD